nr:uncharacterized protein LOC118877933 isoform X2 [Drosophila suzukii]
METIASAHTDQAQLQIQLWLRLFSLAPATASPINRPRSQNVTKELRGKKLPNGWWKRRTQGGAWRMLEEEEVTSLDLGFRPSPGQAFAKRPLPTCCCTLPTKPPLRSCTTEIWLSFGSVPRLNR